MENNDILYDECGDCNNRHVVCIACKKPQEQSYHDMILGLLKEYLKDIDEIDSKFLEEEYDAFLDDSQIETIKKNMTRYMFEPARYCSIICFMENNKGKKWKITK